MMPPSLGSVSSSVSITAASLSTNQHGVQVWQVQMCRGGKYSTRPAGFPFSSLVAILSGHESGGVARRMQQLQLAFRTYQRELQGKSVVSGWSKPITMRAYVVNELVVVVVVRRQDPVGNVLPRRVSYIDCASRHLTHYFCS